MTRALLAALAALALLAPVAGAQQERASLPDIEDEVMCVQCNIPLFIADAPQATRQREYIRGLIAQGLTKEQIKTRLVGEYGEDVLALPEEEGVGIAAYAVPIATFAALVAIFALLVPRWRRRGRQPALAGTPGTAAAAAVGATDAELARLDDDLRRRG
jgi:cytochrome c-type biogenesis protein CcmH/NrfF